MITKDQLKIYLWITDNSQDDLLDLIIAKSIWLAEAYTMQILNRPTEAIVQVDRNDWVIFIENYHNLSISKVYENTGDDFSPTWTQKTDWFYLDQWWVLKTNFTSNLDRAIKIEYFAWFTESDIPEDLKGALIELWAYLYSKAGDWKILKSETVDWDRVEFEIVNWTTAEELPNSIALVFDKYRKYEIWA